MANNNQTNVKEETQLILTDDASKMAAKIIKKRRDTFNFPRRTIVLEIKANIAYLIGEQNIQLVGNNIVALDRERSIETIENQILPAVQRDIAVGTMRPAVYDVVPAGTDDDDRATAIAAGKVIPYLQRKYGKTFARGETILWYDISGVGWRKVYWDPDVTVIGINPAPTNENGTPNTSHIPDLEVGQAITEGETVIEVVPTGQLIYDFRNPRPDRLPWIIHARRVNAEWVINRYGIEVYKLVQGRFTTSHMTGETTFETNIVNVFNNYRQKMSGDTDQRMTTPRASSTLEVLLDADKEIDFFEYWAKPTKSTPTGMYAEMLGDQLAMHSPFPIDKYPHGELPFTPAFPLHIQGATLVGPSRISQARPLQRKLNRLASQIAENNDIMNNAVLMARKDNKIAYRKLDNRGGLIIEYEGQNRPDRQPGIPMSSQIFVYYAQIKEAIDDIFAFHAPSKGKAPRNIDSGKGIVALQNQDTIHMGPIVEAFEEADERVVYQALVVSLANYEKGRLLNIVGDDYEWTTFELDPEQLRGKFNVIIKQRSSFPLDTDQERSATFSAWQSGLLGDPQDPEIRLWAMQQIKLGNVDNLMQKHSKQQNFAKMEFVAMLEVLKEAAPLPADSSKEQVAAYIEQVLYTPDINPFDDHMIHQYIHNQYLMDNYWKLRKGGNPLELELLRRMIQHTFEHQSIINEIKQNQFQQQLQAQMLIKGKTPEQIVLSKLNFNSSDEATKKTKK